MCAFMCPSLHCRQQTRSYLVRGAGAQDACGIILLKPSWLIHPSLLLVSCSHGGRSSGVIRCSSSSVWRRTSVSTNASGEAQTIEQVWEEYFADPLQWWDNRVSKRNPKSPDFKHKVTKKALWVDSWSTPPWVEAKLKLVTSSKLPSPVGHGTSNSQEIGEPNRLTKGNFGGRITLPTGARKPKETVRVGGGSMHMPNAETTTGAIGALKNRLQQGIAIDWHVYVEVLKRCLKQEDLTAVEQVHECIIEGGVQQNKYVATNLLSAYIRCGRVEDARRVFDVLVKKDIVCWTIMIGGYAQHSGAEDAMEVFYHMRQAGVHPDAVTYLSILKACVSPSALKWGKEVHAYIRQDGFESDVRVGTAVLKMYAKCGSINDARKTFDKLASRDVICWNVMIGAYAENGFGEEAYGLFLQMIREGFRPSVVTYVSILNACASAGALEWVKDVHGHAKEAGLESDVRVGTSLVHTYAKCCSLDDAQLVFDRMEKRDVVTWTAMVGAYAESGCGEEAYRFFVQMIREGFKPNVVTYLSILNACASAGALEWVKGVHSHAREGGFESDVRVGNSLVHMYAKCGSIDGARVVFDRMEKRDVRTWNVIIGAYAESGCGEEAYRLFLEMKRECFKPDAVTYVNILNACASAGALEWVKDVHGHARDGGFESDLRVGNALVHMYAKCGSIDDARLVFDRMEERDLITWNVMIGGLAQHGCGSEALELFRKMIAAGVQPDGYSFVAVLSACSHAGLVDEGRRFFLAMSQDYGIVPSVVHYNCMVDILGRAGLLEEAKLFIGNMPVEPVEATWGALLSACRSYGNVELGELVAKERVKLEPKKAATCVLLSNIYAAAEKWEEVSSVRNMMLERGICKEPGRSWIEVDNKIHTFLVGDTSHPESEEIYAELSRLTEKIKAEGYLPDTRLVLQDIDEKDKEFSVCSHSEKLAIAYGLIRTPSSKPVRVYKNLRVCSDCHTATKLISKVTRKEIVVRDVNRFHHFKDGLCSCKDYW